MCQESHCTYMADTLSRAPLQDSIEGNNVSSIEVEYFVEFIRAVLPASTDHLKTYSQAQANNEICSKLIKFCNSAGQPEIIFVRNLKITYDFEITLTLSNTLLLYQVLIAITSNMRQQTLEKIHHDHQKCRLRVASSIWWTGVSNAVENLSKALIPMLKSIQSSATIM